jgi:superfamily I DNA/RNA helicase
MPQIQLNEEQMLAVQHPVDSPACLIAGAGSGKTRVLTERVRYLINQGVPPRKICCVTFTNKAANELLERLELEEASFDIPKVSTIHSLALGSIRQSPPGFGLQNKVTPLDDYDQTQMLRRIVEREVDIKEKGISLGSYVYNLLEKVGFHRSRGLGFSEEYTDEVHERAQIEHAGYHALEPLDMQIWKAYEEEKKKNSVVDFDDMLHLVVRRLRTDDSYRESMGKRFEHVLMDEAQDTNPVQWEFVNSLLSPTNKNFYVVGDMSQCQPAGTMVRTLDKPGHGTHPATYKDVSIESFTGELQLADVGVVSWTKCDQRTYAAERGVRAASRFYKGPLLTIHAANNLSTRVTPNHWLWVRFNKNTRDKYIVYLMQKDGYGFRVGMSKFKKNMSQTGFGLSSRLNCERGNRAWILRVCDSRPEAEAWEEIVSIKYGIPESVFNAEHACVNKTQDFIKLVFSHADPKKAVQCLEDYGLDVNTPLVERSNDATVNQCNRKWRGYFKTIAANAVPIASLLDIPLPGVNQSTPISSVTSAWFEGQVYSLDVEKDHTYIADGLVVGNCIYAFNGAVPKILKDYSEGWRGHSPMLYRIARNHRSLPRIVYLANHIQSKMTATIPLKMQVFRGDAETKGTLEITRASLPLDVAMIIAGEIYKDNARKRDQIPYKENCILVRSARQVPDIESALVRHRVPYQVRGGRGLLQTEEIRDVLSYLRLATNPKDFTALARAVTVPKTGAGDVTLEKIRKTANEKFGGDLIKGCTSIDKLSTFVSALENIQKFGEYPVQALDKIIDYMNYKTYIASKYKKEPDKVKSKLENIERFRELVRNLSEDQKMSTEDLVFQLTLDRAREDDKDGMVTVSTIHSAKGLEWTRVYVTNIVEGSLPHRFSMGSEEEVEEERRLFYVACTRAKDWLTLCVPAMAQNGTDTIRQKPSRFLVETGVLSE